MAEQQTGLIEYESNGEVVKLSPGMIKKFLVNGGGNVTDQEVMMFLSLCRYQKLNPFLKEAHLIKYKGDLPATMVVGKDVFTKRAQSNPNCEGFQAGIFVVNEKGELIEREGSMVLPKETIVGGWGKVYVKGNRVPQYSSVSFEEYVGRKKDGTINGQWAGKPATMIRKVALVQALREAFPDNYEGMYVQEEFKEIHDVKLDAQEIVVEEINESANSVELPVEEEVIDAEVVDTVLENDLPSFMTAE